MVKSKDSSAKADELSVFEHFVGLALKELIKNNEPLL